MLSNKQVIKLENSKDQDDISTFKKAKLKNININSISITLLLRIDFNSIKKFL